MGLDPARTVVIEDSEIGLAAAKAAGMKCVVTKSSYTKEEVSQLHARVAAVWERGDGMS